MAEVKRYRYESDLQNEWGLPPLRVRRLPRVTLHANLTILAELADAVIRVGADR